MSSCNCQSKDPATPPAAAVPGRAGVGAGGRPLSSLALGLVVAFFPKCPMCWAAYCSALGLAGMSGLPHFRYVFSAILLLLGLHLLLLLRQAGRVGYGPFAVSLAGALILLAARGMELETEWVSRFGVLLVAGGSIWHSFAMRRRRNFPGASAMPAAALVKWRSHGHGVGGRLRDGK